MLGLVAVLGGKVGALLGMVPFFLAVMACVATFYSGGARRWRDLLHSGWMVLLFFEPFVSLLFHFYLGFTPSKPQD